MEDIKNFIKTLCDIDLLQNAHSVSDALYSEIETTDIDLQEETITDNKNLPYSIRTEIINLIEFYLSNADDCINKYSDKEALNFLKQLKWKAEKILPYIINR